MSKFSDLVPRLIAALIGAFIIISSLIVSPWAYFVVFLVISFMTQWEFYRLLRMKSYIPLRPLGVAVGVILFVLSFVIESGRLSHKYYLILLPLASLIFFFKLYKKTDSTPFINIGFYYLGIVYVALPFAILNHAVFMFDDYSYEVVVGLLFTIWASDVGAYFAGSMFGKTKLFERISPKKSWEGSIGGAVLAAVFAHLNSLVLTDLALWQWLTISAIVVIVGTYGDLVESLFKRTMAIKDSGKSIPGHGGFLDRFDSLILSIPFIIVFLELFK